MGSQPQGVLFVLTDEDHGARLRLRGRRQRPEAPPFGLGAAKVAREAQFVFTCKKLYSRWGSKIFMFKPLVRAQIIKFNFLREFLRRVVDLKGQGYPSIS